MTTSRLALLHSTHPPAVNKIATCCVCMYVCMFLSSFQLLTSNNAHENEENLYVLRKCIIYTVFFYLFFFFTLFKKCPQILPGQDFEDSEVQHFSLPNQHPPAVMTYLNRTFIPTKTRRRATTWKKKVFLCVCACVLVHTTCISSFSQSHGKIER